MVVIFALLKLAIVVYGVVYFADKLDKYYAKKKEEKERLRKYAEFSLQYNSVQQVSLGEGKTYQETTTPSSTERGERK